TISTNSSRREGSLARRLARDGAELGAGHEPSLSSPAIVRLAWESLGESRLGRRAIERTIKRLTNPNKPMPIGPACSPHQTSARSSADGFSAGGVETG